MALRKDRGPRGIGSPRPVAEVSGAEPGEQCLELLRPPCPRFCIVYNFFVFWPLAVAGRALRTHLCVYASILPAGDCHSPCGLAGSAADRRVATGKPTQTKISTNCLRTPEGKMGNIVFVVFFWGS